MNKQIHAVWSAVCLMICGAGVGDAADQSQKIEAETKDDRIVVKVAGNLFTEYLCLASNKYPYFYPLNGPRTGLSLTTHKTEPYPHHSSLFFGCDRVNGGNYWQEGLNRGRIVSRELKLIESSGERIVFEQDCDWERPGAPSPFSDHRRIVISAPSPELRFIDFEIVLRTKIPVRIEKNNHSLFAARMAPELSVKGGGRLVNAAGAEGETGTFGQPSPWADYSGVRQGQREGLAIFVHPENRWFPPRWFTRDYGFFSPTPMWWLETGALEMKENETVRLRYRAVVHADDNSSQTLQALYSAWSGASK